MAFITMCYCISILKGKKMIPLMVQIELTNYCNGNCKYCPHKIMKRKQEFMPIEKYKLIIDKCKNEGVKIICPFLTGESALHPDFIEALRYTKEQGLTIYLYDNMSLIDKQMADVILDLFSKGDMINCSIDSINPITYKEIKRLDFDKTIRNTNYLINEYFKQKKEFFLNVQQIRYLETDTSEEINNFMEYFKKWAGEYYNVNSGKAMNWAGAIENKREITGDKCIRLERDMPIQVNGNVCLCCLDYEGKQMYGNIFKYSIKEIYNCEELNKVRDNFPSGMCKKCDARWQS